MAGDVADEQLWLDRRLGCLEVEDFDGDVLLCCTSNLQPPVAFQHLWRYIPQDAPMEVFASLVPEGDISGLKAILIFCNQENEEEVGRLGGIIQSIDYYEHEAPPILWVLHSVAPEMRPSRRAAFVDAQLLEDLLRHGLDEVIEGEPEGLDLAMRVRTKVDKCSRTLTTLQEMIAETNSRHEHNEYIKSLIDFALWDYGRTRLAPEVPPVDSDILAGQPQELPGFAFGRRLGKGAFGSVFEAHEVPDRGNPMQVAKVLDKGMMKTLEDIKFLNRMTYIARYLSSDEMRHPCLVRLYETYHTQTHIVYRMENGGPENLYRRLAYRQARHADQERPLAFDRVLSIMRQLLDVLSHLHLAKVAHRDIKPENIIVNETDESVAIKLADYDMSTICKSGSFCRSSCGTLPFVAPEVMLSEQYDGLCADVWSMGIVLLEVVCGVRVVEQAVAEVTTDLQPTQSYGPNMKLAEGIRSYFQGPNAMVDLLEARTRAELRSLLPTCRPLLAAMIQVDTGVRIDSDEARSMAAQGFPGAFGASLPVGPPLTRRRPTGTARRS